MKNLKELDYIISIDVTYGKGLTHVEGHCRTNSSHKDQIYAEELKQISSKYFESTDEKGELRDHLVNLSQKDMADATLNIAAGIRWLYRKRETASAKLHREATWLESAADYKSYLEDWRKNPKHEQMNKLKNFYERLKE